MEARRNVEIGPNSGRLELTDGTTVEWSHDGGRDIEINPSRELTEEETIEVMELIDETDPELEGEGQPMQIRITGADAGPIVEGITREEEGEIGDAEPAQGTWTEFTRLEEIRDEIVNISEEQFNEHPYDLEPGDEMIIELDEDDLRLIERVTGIRIG